MKKGYVFIILMVAHISMAESIDPSLKNSYSSWNQSSAVGNTYAGNDKNNFSDYGGGFTTYKDTENYKIGDQYNSSSFAGVYGANKDWGANITMDKSADNVGNQYSDSLSSGSGSYSGSVNKSWTDARTVEGGVSYSTLSKSNLTREQIKNRKMKPPATSKPMSQPASSPKTTPSPTPYNNHARKEESRKLAEQKRKAPRPALPSQTTMSQSSQQMQSMRPGGQMTREQQLLAERKK